MNKCRFAVLMLMGLSAAVGCQSHPASPAMTMVGDTISDVDVQSRAEKLVGRSPADADALFGRRIDRLRTLDGARTLAVYPVQDDPLNKNRWVVEIENQRITALSKTQRQPDGADDVIKAAMLQEKLIGKAPAEFKTVPGFDKPVLVGCRESTNTLLRVYDVHNWTNLRGARYCVLEFNKQNQCTEVRLVGINSSTKADPAAATPQ